MLYWTFCDIRYQLTGQTQDFKSKRRNCDLRGKIKERIFILYVTHLPFLFSDVTDKESQRITEDLSMRGYNVAFKFLSFVIAKCHKTLLSFSLSWYSSHIFLCTETFTWSKTGKYLMYIYTLLFLMCRCGLLPYETCRTIFKSFKLPLPDDLLETLLAR